VIRRASRVRKHADSELENRDGDGRLDLRCLVCARIANDGFAEMIETPDNDE